MNEITPATLEHALSLASRLRRGDLQEIAAATGDTPEAAVVVSLATSVKAWTWLRDGTPMAIFGVAGWRGRPGVGIPWMLAADGFENGRRYVVSQSRKYVSEMLAEFPVLENFVDCRNTRALEWLSWCGFYMVEELPRFGVEGVPFYRFNLAREE